MLLAVLWVMGLVAIAVGGLTAYATHETRLGRVPLESLQRKAIAQAAIQQATRVIRQDTQEHPEIDTLQEPWATGVDAQQTPLFERIAIGDGMFSIGRRTEQGFGVGLIDEERKLSLNTAPIDALRRLIESVAPGADAQHVAEAIADWRDEAEGPVCASAAPPCHNGPLASIDELRLVPGVTAELFAALQPYVTVYGSGIVNVNTAPALVLNALGEPGEQLVQQRSAQPFTSYPNRGVTSTVFTVPVEALVSSSASSLRVTAVINRSGVVLAYHPAE